MENRVYQKETMRTLKVGRTQEQLNSEMVMGLAGEVGEVVELFKKHMHQGHLLDISHLKEELGDVLWYLSNLANINNLSLSEIMDANIAKLKERYPKGFTTENSINRK